MRQIVAVLLVSIFAVTVGAVSLAENQMGIADVYKINFDQKIRVADTLLPEGNYEIRHVMEGPNHIMVFRRLGSKTPVEVRAKCNMVPLPEKAYHDQTIYTVNAANERVLQELIFKGDRAKHVF